MNAQQPLDPQAVHTYLTELWRRLLKRDIALTDDFFEAGGNSLTALRMVMEVQKDYRVEIDVESFFESSSISKLADIITRGAESRREPA
ncbi:acyl carrier protein [Myxococcus stipitatus]|uniref:acyl carrier protein n=1 Tax=Myxococcus stipitatus TaxID=83455 RepID=UPI0030D0F37A